MIYEKLLLTMLCIFQINVNVYTATERGNLLYMYPHKPDCQWVDAKSGWHVTKGGVFYMHRCRIQLVLGTQREGPIG